MFLAGKQSFEGSDRDRDVVEVLSSDKSVARAAKKVTTRVRGLHAQLRARSAGRGPGLRRTPSTHGLFDFHFSSKVIPIVIPI